jgi:hypothetical protein
MVGGPPAHAAIFGRPKRKASVPLEHAYAELRRAGFALGKIEVQFCYPRDRRNAPKDILALARKRDCRLLSLGEGRCLGLVNSCERIPPMNCPLGERVHDLGGDIRPSAKNLSDDSTRTVETDAAKLAVTVNPTHPFR